MRPATGKPKTDGTKGQSASYEAKAGVHFDEVTEAKVRLSVPSFLR